MQASLLCQKLWFQEYRKIQLMYNPNGFTMSEETGRKAVPMLDVRASMWAEEFLEQIDDGQTNVQYTADTLEEMTDESHHYAWAQIGLWLLAYDRHGMMKFLLATHTEPYVPVVYIETSLRQLGAHIYHSEGLDREAEAKALADAFCTLVNRGDNQRLTFENPFLRLLLSYCSVKQNLQVYQAVTTHNVRTLALSWCHYVSYFAKNDYYQQSLDALVKAHEIGGFLLNGWIFRSVCSTLLRRSITQPDGLRESLRVVSTIVDMGVVLDNPICDIIMLNAIEAGDLKTAFDVYHSLMQRGLRPTERTFTVLLKGCKTNIDNVEMLNEVIRDAISNINVRASTLVTSNIMHCLALHHSKHHPETALQTLTEAYVQFFDLAPLQRLGLPMPTIPPTRMTTEDPMPPTPHVLGYMIGASINHTLQHDQNPKQIIPLYTRWRELTESGDPAFAVTATTDHIANIFLSAFIRRPSGLLSAAQLVKAMQRPLPESAGVQQIQPTVQTWNIFLHGFSRHGQTKLAEKVLNYMRSKGVPEDTVTWNTLLMGYAKVQNLDGAVDVIKRGGESGAVWDQWTDSGVARLRDRKKQDVLRRRLEDGREIDFSAELKEGLGERLGGGESVEQGRGHRSVERDDGYGDSPADLAHRGGSVAAYKPF